MTPLCTFQDTAYNPLAVDEVAAQHISADCVVHYGRASLTQVNSCPSFFVYPKAPLPGASNVARQLVATVAASPDLCSRRAVLVIIDQVYEHVRHDLEDAIRQAVKEAPSCPKDIYFSEPAVRRVDPANKPSSSQAAAEASAGDARCCSNQAPCASRPQLSSSAEAASAHTCATDGVLRSCCRPDAANAESYGNAVQELHPEPKARQTCQPNAAAASVSKDAEVSAPLRGVAGDRWRLPDGLTEAECAMVWVGSGDAPALQMLQLAYSSCAWLCCEPPGCDAWRKLPAQGGGPDAEAPCSFTLGVVPATKALLKRRYFYVERAKEASIVGILVGTLACEGFREAIALVRRQAQAAGKKTYTFVMGKPNPAKLANFPEVKLQHPSSSLDHRHLPSETHRSEKGRSV